MAISAVDAVQPAFDHARQQLFARFRWGMWWRLALVGLLAGELHVGGCNFGRAFGPLPQSKQGGKVPVPIFHPPHIDPARLSQLIGLILMGALAVIVVGFILLYVNSVFRFILFDSVLRRDCSSVGDGWDRWRRAGRRYFLWQLVYQISVGIFFLMLVGIPLMFAASAGWIKDPSAHIGRLAGSAFLLIAVFLFCALVAVAVQILARDFLVPIMAIEDLDFADGWSRLLSLIRPEPGKFILYLLMKLVLLIGAAIIFGIAAVIPVAAVAVPIVIAVLAGRNAGMTWNVNTISLAVIFGTLALLLLVYLISLVSVPASVFFPAYAMYFLAGRYPNLQAVLNPAPITPAPQSPPPIPESPPPLSPTPEPIG